MGTEADSHPPYYHLRRMVWGLVSLLFGATCWVLGDGRSLGVNPPISDNAKLIITLVGWPYVIDGVRILRGHQSFMRRLYPYVLYALGLALAVCLVIWVYILLSLKALVALGLIAAIALLVFILRELRASRG